MADYGLIAASFDWDWTSRRLRMDLIVRARTSSCSFISNLCSTERIALNSVSSSYYFSCVCELDEGRRKILGSPSYIYECLLAAENNAMK